MKYLTALAAALLATTATAAPQPRSHPAKTATAKKADAATPAKEYFKPAETRSAGNVIIGGQPLAYETVAGTLVVHAKDWEDTDAAETGAASSDIQDKTVPKPEASMFYTAYFKQGAPAAGRPITFLFNGGPGSSSIWLHMGAFGPVRVQTTDGKHNGPAPYSTVNNDQTLLDTSDLVFIDAPGTGFSRIAGKDIVKAFYGVD
jgi:carboxypeptidase C (cathepsin A)